MRNADKENDMAGTGRVTDTEGFKTFSSENANYYFNKKTGYMESWGKTREEDAGKFPSPTILDIEVTTKCTGVNGKVCPFCFPEGTMIRMPDGSEKPIESIQAGDRVKSYNGATAQTFRSGGKVKETYQREYEGELIAIELENGKTLRCTPNHKLLTERGWVEAGKLTEDDVLIDEEMGKSFHQCSVCGKVHKGKKELLFCCSEECLSKLMERRAKTCPSCGKEFTQKRDVSLFCPECSSHIYPHGCKSHPLKKTYDSMLQRCYNPKRASYQYYGAKGISVCERWLDFHSFVEDMYPSYQKGLTLDRIDNSKGYSPDNCRWADPSLQRANRNRFRGTKNPYRGVSKAGSRYQVRCRLNKKYYYLGSFRDIESAKRRRDEFMKENRPSLYETYLREEIYENKEN